MSKRPSDAVSDMLAIKAARTDRSAQVSPVAAATKDTGSQTDSTVATQIHELRMALLKIKAAFVPQKAHGKRDGQSEEAFDELEAERDSLLDQMDEGAEELVPEALRILDDLELACCIPRRRKSVVPGETWKDVFECLDRDTLDTMQLTSRVFDDVVSSSLTVVRVINAVTFENAEYNV
ncbi:hypothetical protein AAVH_16865 [Aphelenchoides avenae]|nr:hypothetical protein AAVH_16865 [Aphelenchus avenae]